MIFIVKPNSVFFARLLPHIISFISHMNLSENPSVREEEKQSTKQVVFNDRKNMLVAVALHVEMEFFKKN